MVKLWWNKNNSFLITKMNLISFNPNALSLGVLSHLCGIIVTRFQFLVWSLSAMVFGSIVLSSNPHEKLWRHVKVIKTIMDWCIGMVIYNLFTASFFSLYLFLIFSFPSSSSLQVKKSTKEEVDLLTQVKFMMEAQRTDIKQSLVDIQRTSANDMSTLRTQMATLKQFMTDFQTS